MPTYLVTGAAGFIGAKVCEFLLQAGHAVVGLDNLNDYYDVRLKDYRLGQLLRDEAWRNSANPRASVYAAGASRGAFVFRAIDIENLAALDRLFREFRFDAVFNLSARAGVRYSMENPHVYLSSNAAGALNLLECVRHHAVKKFVLASTSSLYAGCALPFTEDQPVNHPISPYAASKKAAEVMSYTYHKLYGVDVSVLRYFTVYGPAGRPDMGLFRFIKAIDEDQPIQLFGDGSQGRDFTYIDDIAQGTIAAARPLGYEIINLGGGNHPVPLTQLIAMLETLLQKKARVREKSFSAADMMQTWASIEKAEELLQWRPRIGLADGLRATVEWHLRNKAWLKAIET